MLFQIWCGPLNCLHHPNISDNVYKCADDQTCVVQTDKMCFTPPCLPWGNCEDLNKHTIPYIVDRNCVSKRAELSNNCAKISLVFDKSNTPTVCPSNIQTHIMFLLYLYINISYTILAHVVLPWSGTCHTHYNLTVSPYSSMTVLTNSRIVFKLTLSILNSTFHCSFMTCSSLLICCSVGNLKKPHYG